MSLSTNTYCAGDVIACSSQPFVHALDNNYKGEYCDQCLGANRNLIQCETCGLMYYCGPNCRSLNWNIHQLECKIFAKHIQIIRKNFFFEHSMALLRLILVLNSNQNLSSTKYSLHNGEYNCFEDLMSHQKEVKHDWSEEINDLLDLLNEFCVDFTFDELCRIVGQYNTNSFGLHGNSDTDYTEFSRSIIGYGIYINLSVFDHSCQPNAAFINDGINMQIRAMTRIEPYDEITVPYISIEIPKSERQSMLKRDYCFDCCCFKCEHNIDEQFNYLEFNKLLDEYKEIELSEICYKNYINSKKFKEKLENGIDLTEKILYQKKMLHKNNSPDCSNAMYVHSLLLMIAKDCGVSGYTAHSITPFLKSTEYYMKITHGIDHNMYKKFVKTGRELLLNVFLNYVSKTSLAVRSDTSDKLTHFHAQARRQLARKSSTSTPVFQHNKAKQHYASEHSCQLKRVREHTTERNVERRLNCAEDSIREAFESLDEIPNDNTLQWKVYYGDPNNERSVIVNVSVENTFALINSAAFKAKLHEPISLSVILK